MTQATLPLEIEVPDTADPKITALNDSPLTGSVKGERSMMAFPFFHLAKGRRMKPITYDDGTARIEVRPSSTGLATIYDKDILLYLASLMVEKINKGEAPGPEFTFTAHDFIRVVGANRSARTYARVAGALERLQGTQIRTNIEAGGEGEDGWFSWIAEARVAYVKGARGEKRLKGITVRLCNWMHRAILKDLRILTYDHRYFALGPIERRLYELARSHCGKQPKFVIRLERLYEKVGCEDELRNFKVKLKKIAAGQTIPEYFVSLVDDPASAITADQIANGEAPRPAPGRQPLVAFHPKGGAAIEG